MSSHDAGSAPHAASDGWGAAPAPRWTPIELMAMVLGFVVFWPIGLAILAWKFWQRRTGYRGDLRSFADERMDQMKTAFPFGCGGRRDMTQARQDWAQKRWGAFQSGGFASTGNRAFDEWKSAELARLEEERRKLHEAQREFSDYLAHLRQARDKEEFERFVGERDAAKARGEAGWRPFPDSGERAN